MPETKVLFFDAVGTLIYPRVPVAQTYEEAGRRFGSQLSRQHIQRRFLNLFRELFDRRNQTLPTSDEDQMGRWRQLVGRVIDDVPDPPALFAFLWDYYARASAWSVYPDVQRSWRQWRSDHWKLGIASNFDSRLHHILSDLQPLDQFEHVYWSGQLKCEKPDHEFYHRIVRRLRLPAERCLMLGDSFLNDYVAPRACGWSAILLDRTDEKREEETGHTGKQIESASRPNTPTQPSPETLESSAARGQIIAINRLTELATHPLYHSFL